MNITVQNIIDESKKVSATEKHTHQNSSYFLFHFSICFFTWEISGLFKET
jgi:hypothetical protein